MNTNLIGVVFAILSTNWHKTEFYEVKNGPPSAQHMAVDRYIVTETKCVNAIENGVASVKTLGESSHIITLTNWIADTKVYVPILNRPPVPQLFSIPILNTTTNN